MRDYQPNQKNNPYWMEKSVYRRVLAFVRDYDRMVRDYHEILHETAASDGYLSRLLANRVIKAF